MPYAHNGHCELYYDTFGHADDPTLLLVNGLGSQCINYHDDWCHLFADRGLRVVRFDNRDVGLSSKFDDADTGPHGAAYTLSDMAADGMVVLDAVGAHRAHVMGLSMGGMIVQTMAIEHPHRLLTMTSAMSNTGEPDFGGSTAAAQALLLAPPAHDREGAVQRWIAGLREWGSPEFADEARWRADAERAFDRCFHPTGPVRQYLAVMASGGSRAERLRHVQVPTLVIHGDCDTLIDISGGLRTAEVIPGARFEMIAGMGHDYPPQLWHRWVELVVGHIEANTPVTEPVAGPVNGPLTGPVTGPVNGSEVSE
ncbi:MAG: alpha/beta hydrolase [Actinomycetota bacterium]|nr:alpha/beta hydrolase [Actinomycetota bacterium]